MSKTIKEIAQDCGVSEQSIRKWCAKHEVSQVAKQWKPNENEISAIYRHYGKEVSQVAKPTKPSCETNETLKTVPFEVYQELTKQLEIKDEQIRNLNKALLNAQEQGQAAQLLHAADRKEDLIPENQEQKIKYKSRWQRLKEAWKE
ncbi:hypothetical protein [Adlercreutzia sp. ZJ304]|uniref:hypothetical protein n=1 Tax=Adlercreutzia sp. ZJ304 TaxID=2709791 RepID=UPI0013ECD9A5|nr:hypothetical protein [Adlercreutzia sp. ZJ304]